MKEDRGQRQDEAMNHRHNGTHERLVDIETVAKRLGVQVRHVRRLVHERRIPYVKWGHLLRFDPAEIDAWIDRARVAPGARDASRRVPRR